jgi:hypothetical protein
VEQRGSKLKGLFSEEMASGEKHFFDRIGSFTANEITGNLLPIDLQDGAHSRRMASLGVFDAATYVQNMDKLKMIIDPTSSYAIKLANAHGKNYDRALIDALLGTAATGKDGGSTAPFDTANQQIAHGSTGLTVEKFLTALRILQANEVDMDVSNIYLLADARGIEDLLGDTKFTSHDYQATKPLAGRMLPEFRGVKIVHTERIPEETPGSVRRAILCTDEAIKVAMGQDLKVDISRRNDLKDLPFQIYTEMAFGAVRMEEELVVDVLFQ